MVPLDASEKVRSQEHRLCNQIWGSDTYYQCDLGLVIASLSLTLFFHELWLLKAPTSKVTVTIKYDDSHKVLGTVPGTCEKP